ncbi:MAG TPA: trypsin-like serine protease [Myxococcales bacterium]|nr:trypsin-like serine protease [Myxococcales bacterium]
MIGPPSYFPPLTSSRGIRVLFALIFALGFPLGASALVLDDGKGQGNTTAPENDPGWRNVGQHLGSPSVVYLGNRWILTADHVGASIVILEGKRYDPVSGSLIRLKNSDGTQADLLLFKIAKDPGLPMLAIAESPAAVGEQVILVAAGSSRSERLSAHLEGQTLIDGFSWKEDRTKRWGSNIIESAPKFIEQTGTKTEAVAMVFDRIETPRGTPHEASAARGDSGGALFAHADAMDPDSDWVLSGILFSVGTRSGFPGESSFYGDVTWAADLSYYRDKIIEVVGPAIPNSERAQQAVAQEPFAAETISIEILAAMILLLSIAIVAWRVRVKRRHPIHIDR